MKKEVKEEILKSLSLSPKDFLLDNPYFLSNIREFITEEPFVCACRYWFGYHCAICVTKDEIDINSISQPIVCECGGTKANTTHSHWCPVSKV